MLLSFTAMSFARTVHATQVRPGGAPYISHLSQVAGIVSSVMDHHGQDLREIMIAAAWLHDTMEDQGVTEAELTRRFGVQVARGVVGLTDTETGARAERKLASRNRLARAPQWAQTIKLADVISNTFDISTLSPKFAQTYLEEKKLLLETMTGGDPMLRMWAENNVFSSLDLLGVTA